MRRKRIGLDRGNIVPTTAARLMLLRDNTDRLVTAGKLLEPSRQPAGGEFDVSHPAMGRQPRRGRSMKQKRPHQHRPTRFDRT